LDPLVLTRTANIGYAFYFARQYDQAIEQLKKTLELDPKFSYANDLLGYVYTAKGMYPEAIAEYKKSLSLRGDETTQCYLGYALAQAGQRREAEAILKQLQTSKEYVSPGAFAVLYAGLGEKEQTLESLERAYAAKDPQMQFLKVDPDYDFLRSDERFTALMRKVGLTP
jgi:tetratricopeptide (TPR) repeat protein